MKKKIRIANFMDSSLLDLKRKGNISDVPSLYNPENICEKVVHFTLYENDLSLQAFFEKSRIEIYYYGLFNKSSLLFFPLLFLKILNKIRKEKINVIRGRLPYHGSFFGCLAGKMLKIPSIVSLGGNNRIPQELNGIYHYNNRFFSYNLEKIVLLLADKIICPNKYTQDYVSGIIGTTKAEKKVIIIPWIIKLPQANNIKWSDVCKRFGFDQRRKLVLIVGFLNKYKFSDVIFDAIEKMNKDLKRKINIVFCGDGPLKNKGVERFKNTEEVFFIGWQERNVVQSLIKCAEIILIPMSGFVLLEAASMGKAVVAGDIEWHNEIIENRKNGIIVNPRNPIEWADAVKFLIENREDANIMGNLLKKRFEQHYHPDKAKDKEIRLYLSLLDARDKREKFA